MAVIAGMFIFGCSNTGHVKQLAQTERFSGYKAYQLEKDRYGMIYVKTKDVSNKEIRGILMKKAARIAMDSGHQFFVIESEQTVKVPVKTYTIYGLQRNIYQQYIIEGDFGPGPANTPQYYSEEEIKYFPAIQMNFRTFNSPPKDVKSYDACNFIHCGK